MRIFSFRLETLFFWQIWPKKSKLLVKAELWYPHQFEYAEFNDDAHFFCFHQKYRFWVNFLQKNKIVTLS